MEGFKPIGLILDEAVVMTFKGDDKPIKTFPMKMKYSTMVSVVEINSTHFLQLWYGLQESVALQMTLIDPHWYLNGAYK